jgi:DNA-binding NarL/FixJ family response regulator
LERLELTPRELDVLALLADGLTNREIGAELFISDKTASVHVSRILTKLSVPNRAAAAAAAHQLGVRPAQMPSAV